MSHLAARFRRAELDDQAERAIAKAVREGMDVPPHPNATLAGDRAKLRGIPVEGFGGAIRDTRPDQLNDIR